MALFFFFLLFSFCSLIFVCLSLFFYSSSFSSSAASNSKMAVALPKTTSTWERMWWLREHRTAVVTVHSIIYHHLDSYTIYRTKRNRNCLSSHLYIYFSFDLLLLPSMFYLMNFSLKWILLFFFSWCIYIYIYMSFIFFSLDIVFQNEVCMCVRDIMVLLLLLLSSAVKR